MALISRATVLIIDSLLEPTGSFPWKSVRDQTPPPPPPTFFPLLTDLTAIIKVKKGKEIREKGDLPGVHRVWRLELMGFRALFPETLAPSK